MEALASWLFIMFVFAMFWIAGYGVGWVRGRRSGERIAAEVHVSCTCPIPRETQAQLLVHGGVITPTPKERQ